MVCWISRRRGGCRGGAWGAGTTVLGAVACCTGVRGVGGLPSGLLVSTLGGRAADVSSPVGALDVLRPDAVVGVWLGPRPLLFVLSSSAGERTMWCWTDPLPLPPLWIYLSFLPSLLISTVLYGS